MFLVLEIQKSDTVAHLLTAHESREEAEQKFHTVLSAAAVSSVPVHSAMLITDDGTALRSERYTHTLEA